MNKEEFLEILKKRLSYLNEIELKKHLDFYEEAINDRVDDGMDEYDAINDLGSLNDIVNFVKSEYEALGYETKTVEETKEVKKVKKVEVQDVEEVTPTTKVNQTKEEVRLSKLIIVTIITTLIYSLCGIGLIFGFGALILTFTRIGAPAPTILLLFGVSFAMLSVGLIALGLSVYITPILSKLGFDYRNNKGGTK
ncbi:MAG: hypothetical protein R3Y05_02165 [bacterium]